MARRHGSLPTFQVTVITVFFLLSIAFYLFFAPFLGKDLYEYVAIAVYSFLALSVFILYVRCTAIDPADPGILIGFDGASAYELQGDGGSVEESSKVGLRNDEKTRKNNSTTCSDISCFLCSLFVKEDCCKDEETTQQQASSDEGFFCTLCNAEVGKCSKHCRKCDKCVDGFDHHCRWLNNCIGRKNYITFLCLMAMSLAWLAVEVGVGVTVLVRCFTDKKAFDVEIVDRLGCGFSQASFATIVVSFTALSLLASAPLVDLIIFHMVLISKGLTTYEYVVAMRSRREPPGPSVDEDQQSLPSSPTSSAATAIIGSPLDLQYKGAWCTPPRIFMDQDEIIPHLGPRRIPSTIDPDAIDPSERGKKPAKRPVRISAWKLAKLDPNEAMRAAAKARMSSSVLKPIGSRVRHDTDHCSSSRSSTVLSADIGFQRDHRTGTLRPSPLKNSYPPSSYDLEAYPQTPSSFGSPHHTVSSSHTPTLEQQHANTRRFIPICQSSANRSPLSMKSSDSNESMVDNSLDLGTLRKSNTSFFGGKPRNSVHWDQEAGRFVSSQSTAGSSSRGGRSTELFYTEHKFFGGPFSNEDPVRNFRNLGAPNQRQSGMAREGVAQQTEISSSVTTPSGWDYLPHPLGFMPSKGGNSSEHPI